MIGNRQNHGIMLNSTFFLDSKKDAVLEQHLFQSPSKKGGDLAHYSPAGEGGKFEYFRRSHYWPCQAHSVFCLYNHITRSKTVLLYKNVIITPLSRASWVLLAST